MLDYSKSFIEMQFPVSKISKESYKERKANLGQTLTGLGKWWGRKPLILVRATILGLLMPVSDNPSKDREIFLKILTMDEDGLWLRKSKNISTKDIYIRLSKVEKEKYFTETSTEVKPVYKKGIIKEDKNYLQKMVFNRLSYDEKIVYCERPEHVKITNPLTWDEINSHLETTARSLQELMEQLGEKRFGHIVKIGDCFAGGGSIPFEAGRMGNYTYASDLNPVAVMLNWASMNIAGASVEDLKKLSEFQEVVYEEVEKQIEQWEIESNEKGERADAYLYCAESVCPECGYIVPLAPSWIIGKGTKTVALLEENENNEFNIKIKMDATMQEFKHAEEHITIRKGKMYCPHCKKETPISSLRKDTIEANGNRMSGLRKWEKNEFVARSSDVFTERLYAIRYVCENGRYYTQPSKEDFEREKKVVELLNERIGFWQIKGYVPEIEIEEGEKTTEPIRTRGWKYWHQLFNYRQLLYHGLLISKIDEIAKSQKEIVLGILGVNKVCDWNSKLSIWNSGAGNEKTQNTYTNQALNTLFNYGIRSWLKLRESWFLTINSFQTNANKSKIEILDARQVKDTSDIWITDPPYADAVNYHELTEYFLAWDKMLIKKAFPQWYTDSKRILAVKGVGQTFNKSMIEIYSNLAKHMPDNGYQVVMFTHQDVKVWAELAMILWSAGLRVVSAWNIATETESGGLKGGGNYVKGTVLLTLKKQTSTDMAFQDELYDEIKIEVRKIIDSMRDLDHKDDPDFNEGDYLLASYAASLKVLTSYKEIEGIDVAYWLKQPRNSKEENPIESLINKAAKVSQDYLTPEGFDEIKWKQLNDEERFYIRGIELEMNGVYQISAYQELVKGFRVRDYTQMFAEFKSNATRLKTPSEYKTFQLNKDGFGSTLTRHLLYAIYETTKSQTTVEGRKYLTDTYMKDNEYWYKKPLMMEILNFLSKIEFVNHMDHWKEHAYSAKLLREALKNDGV